MALDQLMIIKWRIINRNVAAVYKIHQIAKLRMLSLVGLLADSEYVESTPPRFVSPLHHFICRICSSQIRLVS